MSYNGETIKDDALERFTCGLMEDVVRHYHDRIEDDNVDKLIERGIAKKLVDWIPEKYTEVDIKATVGQKYTSVIAEFMIDTKTMMVVVHEEVNSVEKKRNNKLDSIIMQGELKSHPGRIYPMPGWNADGTYDPTSITEDFIFPNPAYSEGRGSKVETLPSGQGLGAFGDVEYFRKKIQEATGIEGTSAAKKVAAMNDLISAPVSLGVSSRGCGLPPEPAGIDFTAISGIDVGKAQKWNRSSSNYRSSYYTIDVNAAMQESILNAEKESMIATASERLQELAAQVAYDGMVGTAGTEPTTKALTMSELQELQDKYKDWTCGTSGWSDEFTLTKWDIGLPSMSKDDLTWSVPAEMTWYNPYPLTSYNNNNQGMIGYADVVAKNSMEEIEFTEADLDELVDLINEQISEVMKFA